jgi:hypothetical protein
MGVFPSVFLLPTRSIDVAPEDNPTSEPEPDIALVGEVSDPTLDDDLGPKARLNARAGIVDSRVVDIQGGEAEEGGGGAQAGEGSVPGERGQLLYGRVKQRMLGPAAKARYCLPAAAKVIGEERQL